MAKDDLIYTELKNFKIYQSTAKSFMLSSIKTIKNIIISILSLRGDVKKLQSNSYSGSIKVDDTPKDKAIKVAISSNWAFNHAANPSAHGTIFYEDSELATDHTYSGAATDDVQCGETLVFGDVVYVKSDEKLWKADARYSKTSKVFGIVGVGASIGGYPTIMRSGYIRDDSWSWSVQKTIYLNTTSGTLSQSKPSGFGEQAVMVGVAYSSTKIQFIPNNIFPVDGFITEWTVAGDATARTITLPLYDSGVFDCTIDWGDGSVKTTITSFDDTGIVHTYADDGIYQVEITGDCPSWSFADSGDKLKLTNIINWGNSDGVFTGFSYLTGGFHGCANLKTTGAGQIGISGSGCKDFYETFSGCTTLVAITSSIFDLHISVGTNGFRGTFYGCSDIAAIPTDLFKYNTLISTSGFEDTFYGCTSLTEIPDNLFDYNVAVSTAGFSGTFYGCSGIIVIPTDLFKYNVLVSTDGFNSTFYGCTSVIAISVDLFRYNVLVTTNAFENTFRGCTSLITIPDNLFDYNTIVSTDAFSGTFYGCASLVSIPDDLFKYNVSVTSFYQCFYGCILLATLPEDLFRYNVLVTSFYQCFYGCNALQLNSWIFYATGEEATRFFNQSVTFEECFYRTSFTGTQGTAPDGWNCNFGSGTETGTECYGGAGNSVTSLTNYAVIPTSWGGPWTALSEWVNASSPNSWDILFSTSGPDNLELSAYNGSYFAVSYASAYSNSINLISGGTYTLSGHMLVAGTSNKNLELRIGGVALQTFWPSYNADFSKIFTWSGATGSYTFEWRVRRYLSGRCAATITNLNFG